MSSIKKHGCRKFLRQAFFPPTADCFADGEKRQQFSESVLICCFIDTPRAYGANTYGAADSSMRRSRSWYPFD